MQQSFLKVISFIFITCTASLTTAASQDNYPNKPIKIIVPFTAGGIANSATRIVAEALSDEYKQTVIIENLTGAGGSIGTEKVARSNPDGYTLLTVSPGFAVNKSLIKSIQWDPIKDFDAISFIGSSPSFFVVSPKLNISNMQEYIQYAKENKEKMTYASGGLGSSNHLAGLLLEELADIQLEQVLYRGQPDAISDLTAGRVDSMPLTSALRHYIKNNKVKALAVTSAQRSEFFPEIPTVKEATGLEDYETDLWLGIVAPKEVDKKIVDKLSKDISKIIKSEETSQKLMNLGLETEQLTSTEFENHIAEESKKWSQLFKKTNIRAQ